LPSLAAAGDIKIDLTLHWVGGQTANSYVSRIG
jgi:hypothetical protein